jgi:hypothetical protein
MGPYKRDVRPAPPHHPQTFPSCGAGLWWSVLHGKLSPSDIGHLQAAWPQYLWDPLATVVDGYCSDCLGGVTDPLPLPALLEAYAERSRALALETAAAADPAIVRRVINGAAYPPSAGGSKQLALLSFCSRCGQESHNLHPPLWAPGAV